MSIRLIKTEQNLSPGDLRELRGFWQLALQSQGKSKNTLDVYLSAFDRFTEYLIAHAMPTEAASIRREHVESFIVHLLETKKPATASDRHRSLQGFWKFFARRGRDHREPNEEHATTSCSSTTGAASERGR